MSHKIYVKTKYHKTIKKSTLQAPKFQLFLKVSNLDFNSNNRCTPNRNTLHHHRENLPGGFSQFHYNVKKHKRIFQQLLIKP